MIRYLVTLSVLAITVGIPTAHAASIDLNSWAQESYPAVSGFGAGNWVVSGDGSSVSQNVNGQPTFFHSDFASVGSTFTGTISVSAGDDDYIGFALGFNPGDSTNLAADYLLIDWKRVTQGFNFGVPSNTPGSTAFAGLAVSRVTGIPTADEFWGHTDFSTAENGGAGALEEIQRANNLGSTGWTTNNDFKFAFDFGPNNLDVYVDDILELSIEGSFNDGRFAFYNFSQAGVTYATFEQDDGSFPPIPVPAAIWLFATALVGLAGIGKRRKLG